MKQRDAEILMLEKSVDQAKLLKAQVDREADRANTEMRELKRTNDELTATWRVNAEVKMQSYHQEKKMNDHIEHVTQMRKEEVAEKADRIAEKKRQIEAIQEKIRLLQRDKAQNEEDIAVIQRHIKQATRSRTQPSQLKSTVGTDQNSSGGDTDEREDGSFIGMVYRPIREQSTIVEDDLHDHYGMGRDSTRHRESIVKHKPPPSYQVIGQSERDKACCDDKCLLF